MKKLVVIATALALLCTGRAFAANECATLAATLGIQIIIPISHIDDAQGVRYESTGYDPHTGKYYICWPPTVGGASSNGQFVTYGTTSPPTNYEVLTAGTGITVTPNSGAHTITVASSGGGGGSPGAPQFSVQFNNPLGTFAGDANYTWTPAQAKLDITDTSGNGDVFVQDGRISAFMFDGGTYQNSLDTASGTNALTLDSNNSAGVASGIVQTIESDSASGATYGLSTTITSTNTAPNYGAQFIFTNFQDWRQFIGLAPGIGGVTSSMTGFQAEAGSRVTPLYQGFYAYNGDPNATTSIEFLAGDNGVTVPATGKWGFYQAGKGGGVRNNFDAETDTGIIIATSGDATPTSQAQTVATEYDATSASNSSDVQAIGAYLISSGTIPAGEAVRAETDLTGVGTGVGSFPSAIYAKVDASGATGTFAGGFGVNVFAAGTAKFTEFDGVLIGNVRGAGTSSGLRIYDQGTGANDYAIKVDGGQSKFDGPVQISAVAFSALAACSGSLEGTMRAVTDSNTITWGATITGGSTNHVLAYCDGTNWTVAAK